MKINYDNKMQDIIKEIQEQNYIPKLLLHVCCAPCSSSVLEALSEYFEITVYYYNPNISPEQEYKKRVFEVKNYISNIDSVNPIHFLEGDYEEECFLKLAKGLEQEKEGGARCFKCYYMRLESAAQVSQKLKFDYFTTTLSVSPYKNANKLNEIGSILENKYNVNYLYSDFKKRNRYKRSIELSKQYNLYRQDYCGCIYSKEAREYDKERVL